MRDNVYCTVGIDPDKHIGMQRGEIGLRILWQALGPQKFRVEACAEYERSSGDEPLQESTSADVLDLNHALSSAAALIAARMRWYVPQRQIFPAMAASISWSLGWCVWLNSATACMICPG